MTIISQLIHSIHDRWPLTHFRFWLNQVNSIVTVIHSLYFVYMYNGTAYSDLLSRFWSLLGSLILKDYTVINDLGRERDYKRHFQRGGTRDGMLWTGVRHTTRLIQHRKGWYGDKVDSSRFPVSCSGQQLTWNCRPGPWDERYKVQGKNSCLNKVSEMTKHRGNWRLAATATSEKTLLQGEFGIKTGSERA